VPAGHAPGEWPTQRLLLSALAEDHEGLVMARLLTDNNVSRLSTHRSLSCDHIGDIPTTPKPTFATPPYTLFARTSAQSALLSE